MKLKGGFTNYGQQVGVLMLDTSFPCPPGDIGNANSFDLPARYKTVKGAVQSKIMGDQPEDDLIGPFVAAWGLPVFDNNTLIDTVFSANNPRRYL